MFFAKKPLSFTSRTSLLRLLYFLKKFASALLSLNFSV